MHPVPTVGRRFSIEMASSTVDGPGTFGRLTNFNSSRVRWTACGCRTAWVGPKSWRKRFAAEVRPLSPDVVADGLLEAARAIVRYSEDPVAEAARKSVADPTITS